jgi:hypothetical protein
MTVFTVKGCMEAFQYMIFDRFLLRSLILKPLPKDRGYQNMLRGPV